MGKQWKQCQTLFSWAPKSLQMVTTYMKLKDPCSLEEKHFHAMAPCSFPAWGTKIRQAMQCCQNKRKTLMINSNLRTTVKWNELIYLCLLAYIRCSVNGSYDSFPLWNKKIYKKNFHSPLKIVKDKIVIILHPAVFSLFFSLCSLQLSFPSSSDCKASAYNAGDLGSIPGLGRSPGEGNGTPLQYSCLENPMDRGVW